MLFFYSTCLHHLSSDNIGGDIQLSRHRCPRDFGPRISAMNLEIHWYI
ncbi:hypothetical protein XNC1_1278 [Xenorhabdus nematophila ATCC 19061]|uniref:Uncharacterized protein n=1 Tax=Xenorhabdus nematophila (strain ATCC 19061 / DSM 3370 / CCUG 14189 / LMG 1036 / NCIMB 9965 / AN6) TaxID=406817 RepID=D3V9W1_XENNA|nr:hypothetical protein XNC1_1278 [Xenorhabdus nematophila ATCC 19061]